MPKYIITEDDILGCPSRGSHPAIRVFSLEDSGIDFAEVQASLEPSFADLPWDLYDVRRRQVRLLLQQYSDPPCDLTRLCDRYYLGEIPFEPLEQFAKKPSLRKTIILCQPFRKRAVSYYSVCRSSGQWSVKRLPPRPFSMSVNDYRNTARLFAPMQADATTGCLRRLLEVVATLMLDIKPAMTTVNVTLHQVSLMSRFGEAVTNSPEGIHQDGADYIVSALVISRVNVVGGESVVYGPDKGAMIFQYTLEPGEGIFQADAGSPLWHEVTPIAPASDSGVAIRNIFGFDLHI